MERVEDFEDRVLDVTRGQHIGREFTDSKLTDWFSFALAEKEHALEHALRWNMRSEHALRRRLSSIR